MKEEGERRKEKEGGRKRKEEGGRRGTEKVLNGKAAA